MESVVAELNKLNPNIEVMSIISAEFRGFGREVEGFDFSDLDSYMNNLEMPAGKVVYEPSITEMEETGIFCKLSKFQYGGQPIQIGYCIGDNSSLEGLEYHKGSETLYAYTDLVLLLGHIWDIEDKQYSSKKVEAFFVPQGKAVELYATTLHFSPCKVEAEGFKAVIVLPEGTNHPLSISGEKYGAESEMLFMNNKWLLVHPEAEELVADGAYVGITGDNIRIRI